MLLPSFEYCAPRTVREATALWAARPGARYLAGGTDLIPQMRARRKVSCAIDLKRIAELASIHETRDGGVAIGACVTMNDAAKHPLVFMRYPVLVQCIEEVGAWPLRNRATLVGNLCNASPAADTAVAFLALDATVVVEGPKGERTLPVNGFFKGPGKTALLDGELVKAVVLPKETAGMKGEYLRLSRRKGMDLATVGVLVARGKKAHRIALAAVAPTPLRVTKAEKLLDANGLDEKTIAKAAALAEAAASPITDLRGTAKYRKEMVGVLTARGLKAIA